MNRISFKLPDVGLREITGMAFVEDGFLVLKIETKLIGLVDAERSTVKIEPGALSGARIKYGVLRDRLGAGLRIQVSRRDAVYGLGLQSSGDYVDLGEAF